MKLTASCANCFSGLSTQTRVDIVNLLREKGEAPVLEIAGHFRLTQPTISHHLQYLKETGVLSSRKAGRQVFYFIDLKCKRKECHVFA